MSKTEQPKTMPRRERVLVALALDADPLIRREALARGWRLVNLLYSSLPPGVVPRGALVTLLPDTDIALGLRKQGVPVVRLGNRPHPDDDKVPAVLPDHTAEGALAAEHFFERGFSDVGFFGRDPWGDAQELFEGFHERAEALGMRCHLCQSKQGLEGESHEVKTKRRRREFIAWLRNTPKPLGLLATGDWFAAVYCSWTAEAGLVVPSDIAVLSTGARLDICESSMPSISSLDLDTEGRVRAACDLLERLMAGAPAPTAPIMVPPIGIAERESTDVLATPDRDVAAAMRYMWEHLDLELSVEDVARQVGMSSRQLGRRFQNALGRNVSEELLRKRLEEAKRLLRTTDQPIADVAPMVGFRSTSYLHRCFQKTYKMTPAQYRRARGR